MSNYSSLKSAIDANIKANGRREITGPVLNAILNAVVNSLGDGYLFRGVAVPSTNPGTPDQNVAYLAITEGTYTHMGGLSVTDGELSVFSYNGAWSKIPLALVPTKTSQLDNDLRFVTSEEMGESLSLKQDTIQDLSEIRSNAALGATAYQKPSAGIPASDMTSAVQNSLELAVGSLQKTAQTLTAAEKAQVWNNLGIKEGVSRVVSTLPTTEIDENIVYLVPTANAGEFTEYKYNGSSWDNLGTFTVQAPTVVNDLETGGSTSALSAEMGKVLDGKVSQLDAKLGDLTTLVTPEKASVVGAINSIFVQVNNNLIDINNLSQKWKDTEISWSVANDVLNIVNGNTSANKGIEFYLPANDPLKSYTLSMNCDSDMVLNIFAYRGNYTTRVTIAKNGNTYSGTFNGATSLWIFITLKPSGNVNFSDVSLTEDGVVAEPIIKTELIKELPLSSLEESTQGKISGSAQLDLLKTDFSIPSNADFDASQLIAGWTGNAIRIKNIHSANSGMTISVPAIVGARYKVAFDSDSTKMIFGVTSASNTYLASTKAGVVGVNESDEFIVPDGFGLVKINITVYSGYTVNLTGCYLVRTDNSFLPVEKYSEIPATAIRRRYDVPCNKIYYCETGENIDIFTNGLIDSDTPDGDFTLRLTQPNFYAQDGALGPGFATRFRLKVDATNPTPSKDVAYIYDRFGYASNILLNYIKTGAPVNPGTAKNVLMIGDSLTARLYLPCYFRKYLNDAGLSNWNMIGRVLTNSHPEIATNVRFEANGGYAWPNYVDDPATLPAQFQNNYFWDAEAGHISIQYYMDTYCGGVSPDIVLCNIGWNQFVNGNYSSMTMEEMKVKVKTFLDTLHSEYPNCKAVLTGIQRGQANSKDCNHRGYLDDQIKLARAYQDIAEDENYRGWVIYGNIAPYFDGSIGLQTATRGISMFTDATEEYVLEEVHPNEMGYKIFAFALYQHFLYLANN